MVTTNGLVGSEVPMSIMRCRIPNASGGDCKVMVEDSCSGDGIIVYLFEDEETMMMIILFEM